MTEKLQFGSAGNAGKAHANQNANGALLIGLLSVALAVLASVSHQRHLID